MGDRLRFLLLGGTQIGENALLRFYVLHCVALPLVAFVGIGVHVWRLRKDGGIYLGPAEQTPLLEKPSGRATSHAEVMVSTWPHLLARELVAFLAITLVLVLVSIAFDAPLEAIANPNLTPNPAKAPWYFLGLQELLHYYSPFVSGVLLPALVIVALAAVPYFDLNLVRSRLWSGSELLGATIRQARLRAISSNSNHRVMFDCPSAGEFRSLIMTGDPAVDDAADRCGQTLDGDSGTLEMPAGVAFDPDGATALEVTGRGVFTAA